MDLVQLFVLSRRDPRRMLRDCRLVQSRPASFAAMCLEEFKKIEHEELVVLCSDSWRLGGAMAEAASMLRAEFGSQICSMAGLFACEGSAFPAATPFTACMYVFPHPLYVSLTSFLVSLYLSKTGEATPRGKRCFALATVLNHHMFFTEHRAYSFTRRTRLFSKKPRCRARRRPPPPSPRAPGKRLGRTSHRRPRTPRRARGRASVSWRTEECRRLPSN